MYLLPSSSVRLPHFLDDAINKQQSLHSFLPQRLQTVGGSTYSGAYNDWEVIMLKVGENVPFFSVQDSEGNEFGSKEFLGQRTLLFFYPKASTSG